MVSTATPESRRYHSVIEQRLNHEKELDFLHEEKQRDLISKLNLEAEIKADLRRKKNRQTLAENEIRAFSKLYKEKVNFIEEDEDEKRLAEELSKLKRNKIVDEKMKQNLHEESEEIREMKRKLNLALVNQERFYQQKMYIAKRNQEIDESLNEENEILRRDREAAENEREIQREKYERNVQMRRSMQEQAFRNQQRRRLLYERQRVIDQNMINEQVEKERKEYFDRIREKREKQSNFRSDIAAFMKARKELKEKERQIELENDQKMRDWIQYVDERLERALQNQKNRLERTELVAKQIGIGNERRKREMEEYEQLIVDAAVAEEMERLKQREEAEIAKIQRQKKEIQQFMADHLIEKAKRERELKEEDEIIRRHINEQQERVMRLFEIEQEKARMQIEAYRRELKKQVLQKQEMFERERQEELRRLKMQQLREEDRQRRINEERRFLVVKHIMENGPESLQFLPKAILRDEDLDYLPENIQKLFIDYLSEGRDPNFLY